MIDFQFTFDNNNCWNVLKVIKEGKEKGYANIEMNNNYCFIHSISSFEKGYGTILINHIKQLGITTIEGDADPDSIGFWNKFNPIWNDESFTIQFK